MTDALIRGDADTPEWDEAPLRLFVKIGNIVETIVSEQIARHELLFHNGGSLEHDHLDASSIRRLLASIDVAGDG